MRFYIEFDKNENLFANKKILDSFLFAKNGYPAATKSSEIKFNLNGCLVNALYYDENKTKLEFIPDMID